MESKYWHPFEGYVVSLEDSQRYLDSKQLSCQCCGKGRFEPIPITVEKADWYQHEEHHREQTMVTPLAAHHPSAESFFSLPFVYAVPAVCGECGNIQLFAMDKVLDFLERDSDNE